MDDKNNNRVDNLFLYDNIYNRPIDDKNFKYLKFKSGFSFQVNNLSDVIINEGEYKVNRSYSYIIANRLFPFFEEFLNENKFIIVKQLTYVNKTDLNFNNFLESLKNEINKIANEFGYQNIENEKGFEYIFKSFIVCITEFYNKKNQLITKKVLNDLNGYDIFPDIKNNAHVYVNEDKEAFIRKMKLKRLLE